MGYSTELADRLRRLLFKPRVFRDAKARYDAMDARKEGIAKITWAVHGVCLECRCWSISCGRCPDCAIDYSAIDYSSPIDGSIRAARAREAMVAKQVQLAKDLTS